MFTYKCLVLVIVSVLIISIRAQYGDVLTNYIYPQYKFPYSTLRPNAGDLYLMRDKFRYLQELKQQENVKIQLYYECLCPDCRQFDVASFAPTVKKLAKYLDIYVYPYGNAKTITHQNGTIEIICQHGPAECYGNKLHACAIDNLQNITTSIEFNTCMMESSQKNKGSDDEAADKCGSRLNIDPEPIKSCAKGPRGFALLKYYGDESKKVGFNAVPYILINGVENEGDNFLNDVCAAFKNPPPECSE